MINIKGSYVGGRLDSEECIDFFARGLIKAPFKTAPLKDLPRIFDLMGECIYCSCNRAWQTTDTMSIEQGKIVGRYVLEIPE